ncbi:carbohydrate ABC transporter permease [Candidatus Galacturonibacter soehngenii]|uniref:Sugar ABC transporter permease n=1 Tax=Candidatus Galacturonatibacter soehngenii TaxID=2307010 RepID=A0A7V7QIN8_9FIRM|nr:sugar ABC transporter permease [Candidatus Galacturonibacter soehngenii]KAB1436078.1 sugar ABC transporter permease [Candidatus Galacturonibacter soehngenii]MBA4686182.1 sugar ABC transporter permease [Candidatus Galacturonibacter soehngenii]
MLKKFFYSQKIAPYVFILPFVITVLLFWVAPISNGVLLSFQDVLKDEWVGTKNYSRLLSDKNFFKAIFNSVKYMIGTLVLLIPFPMLFASLLNSKLMKRSGLFKSIYFLPALTSVVVAGTIFRLMFGEASSSLANQVIGLFGASPIKWLKGVNTSYFALLLIACWRWTGVNILYFLAGLQSIPTDLYEAASIDGASKWQQFKKISVPLIKPTTVYVLTISIYAGLSMFLESYMVFKGNNSPNNIGLTIVGYLYRQGIEKRAMGYACAVGLILLVVVMLINLVQLKITGTFDKEEK